MLNKKLYEDIVIPPIHNNIKWNVIDEKEFKERVRTVFSAVSEALTHTLGPYGSTTIIEKFGEMHITKDGWQVLKNIHFDDSINNNILMLLIRISAQVILKVGDGSTSSIVAANSILQQMEKETEFFKNVRPKDFMTILTKCVLTITDRIYENSYKIDKSSYDEIYKLAYISTNGDEEISKMIQDIYVQTNNPAIEYVKSKTDKTFYEIIDGYKLNTMSYIDTIFTTNDDGVCIIDKPMFLMFDHKIDIELSLPIISAASYKAAESNRRLIVVAPNYDKFLLDRIGKEIRMEYNARGTSTVVYTRIALINNISHEVYNDFAVMTGGEIIREQFLEEFKTDQIEEYIGETSSAIINKSNTVIKGFEKRNINMYNKIVEDATSKYKAMEEDYRTRGIVDMKLNDIKGRVTKLKGSMGIINVGGYSTLEKTANFDLIEDAVKACESADMYGYNCGGNLVIPYTIKNILKENDVDDVTRHMYETLSIAFKNVFKTVLLNKFEDEAKTDDDLNIIINNCINSCDTELQCYDLINEVYSQTVINSCITDIEILKATASIISLLVSSNQYISIINSTNTGE